MLCKNLTHEPANGRRLFFFFFEFPNTTLINNWLHEADERQEELPSLRSGRSNGTLNPALYLCGQSSSQLRAVQQRR